MNNEGLTMTPTVRTDKSGEDESADQKDCSGEDPVELELTMDKRSELAFALFFVFFGILMLVMARNIQTGSIPDPISSRGLPNILGAFLLVGGIIQTTRQLLHWSELPGHLVPEEGQADEKGYPASSARAISIMVLSVTWQWLLEPLGYLIATFAYLVACALVMGEKAFVKITLFSIIYTLTTWYIFGPVLSIRIPLGPLEPLALSLGLIR